MYTILFENEYNKKYSSDYYFENVNEVNNYLLEKEYNILNRIYYKHKGKDYIQPLNKYGTIKKACRI